jgi:D-alanyl-D-alanine carboxypeptidase
MYLYSVTKTMLAAATLRLVEQGRLDLDVSVNSLLPNVAVPNEVTLRHVLHHIGGVPDYGPMPDYHQAVAAHPESPWTVTEFLDRTLAHGLRSSPGERFAYSNIGYLLVRLIIERVTGLSLQEALTEHLFAPLGLRGTAVVTSLTDAQLLASGWQPSWSNPSTLENVIPRYHPGWVSHGVVASTALEAARFLNALMAGEIVAREGVAAMCEAVRVPGDQPPFVAAGYGLGLMLDLASPYGLVAGHGGSGPGYSIAVFHFAALAGRPVTVAVLANRSDGGAEPLAFTLAASLADHWS